MRKLNLDLLQDGVLGISRNRGNSWYEAVLVALEQNNHFKDVVFTVSGDLEDDFVLFWDYQLSKNALLSWNDLTELAEEAATGIALLLVYKFTDFKVSWRERKGDKIDYFLSKQITSGILKADALLEVSGILKETKNNRLSSRV
ncbi:MAG: hypothetical protein AAGJ18_23470, partial [Bacteroidota bacterium]